MNTRKLTPFQRKRAKHLVHNQKVQPLHERNRIMRWAITKWGRTTTFGPEYRKYLDRVYGLKVGLTIEVTRFDITLGSYLQWETWAYTLVMPETKDLP